jgi:hypothetical protein
LSEQLLRPCSISKHDQLKAYSPLCDVLFLKRGNIHSKETKIYNKILTARYQNHNLFHKTQCYLLSKI